MISWFKDQITWAASWWLYDDLKAAHDTAVEQDKAIRMVHEANHHIHRQNQELRAHNQSLFHQLHGRIQ